MRRFVFAVATAALLIVPLAGCSGDSGSESESESSPEASDTGSSESESGGWEAEYRQAITEEFANADSATLQQSCGPIATNGLDTAQKYADFLIETNGSSLTLDKWLASVEEVDPDDTPDLSQIVPADADLAEVLVITGEVNIEACG